MSALLAAAGCLALSGPALSQEAAASQQRGPTQGMRYLSWGGKRNPTEVVRPAPEPEPEPALTEGAPPVEEPMRAALADGYAQPLPIRRDRPIIARRPIMSLRATPGPTFVDPAVSRLALSPRPSRGLTPASAWLSPAPSPTYAAAVSAPRSYAETAYVAPAYAEAPYTEAAYAVSPDTAVPYTPPLDATVASPPPATPSFVDVPSTYVEAPPAPPVVETPMVDAAPPPVPPTIVEAAPTYSPYVETPSIAESVVETPVPEAAPPVAIPPVVEVPEAVVEAAPAPVTERAAEVPPAPVEAVPTPYVAETPVTGDAPPPAVIPPAAFDPMAPRADAPVFRMRSAQPLPVESAPAPETSDVAPIEDTSAAETPPAVDPMAPRADAPVFRLNRPEPQAATPQGATGTPAPVPEQQGARYYSVHRQNGRQPDATVLPEGVFLDSLDLAEPPPQPNVTRDRNGQNRAIVPNEDPSLP